MNHNLKSFLFLIAVRRTLKSGLEPDEVTVTKAYTDHV